MLPGGAPSPPPTDLSAAVGSEPAAPPHGWPRIVAVGVGRKVYTYMGGFGGGGGVGVYFEITLRYGCSIHYTRSMTSGALGTRSPSCMTTRIAARSLITAFRMVRVSCWLYSDADTIQLGLQHIPSICVCGFVRMRPNFLFSARQKRENLHRPARITGRYVSPEVVDMCPVDLSVGERVEREIVYLMGSTHIHFAPDRSVCDKSRPFTICIRIYRSKRPPTPPLSFLERCEATSWVISRTRAA